MHFIYLDESGNTGNNLEDAQQPVFVLGALAVPEHTWKPLSVALTACLDQHFPNRPPGFEMHAGDLRQGSKDFRGMPMDQRLALRDSWLEVAGQHQLKFIYRPIIKKRYQKWMTQTFGKGVSINPHLAAFPLVAQVVNKLLHGVGPHELGIFISDDNREVVGDVERFQRLLQTQPGKLSLDRIVEKGFFIDSTKSLPLQLCDLCTYQIRKLEERNLGLPSKSVDDSGIALTTPLIHRGDEFLRDVIQWLEKIYEY